MRNLKLFLAVCTAIALAIGLTSPVKAAAAAYSKTEIQDLVKPIALYPDLLLQQLLAASTFPEQILDAALYQEQGKDPAKVKEQPWDSSVKALANYPSVITMLAKDFDWTMKLADAFINQNAELRDAIQNLRWQAKSKGNLNDSDKQDISQEQTANGETIIRIESQNPEVIYVPASTTTVYETKVDESDIWAPVATFGLGMALGYALNDDDDNDYYYGGYYGPGFWSGDAAENYVDYRRDRWDDIHDNASERQDWRRDNYDNLDSARAEQRQNLENKRSQWKSERQNNTSKKMTPEHRASASNRLNSAKASYSGSQKGSQISTFGDLSEKKGSFSKTGSANYGNIDRESASQRINSARSNPKVQERTAASRNSRPSEISSPFERRPADKGRSNGFSGMGQSRQQIAMQSNRGYNSMSRGSGGSRPSGSFSGSSFSRGGGGGFRGGGGRRR